MDKSIKIRLPFRGQWLVFWGGDTEKVNFHHSVLSQKFAFDFIKVDSDGSFLKGQQSQCSPVKGDIVSN